MDKNIVPARLKETICNSEWLKDNENKVKHLLPETWTHVDNISALQLGDDLKLIGVDWRSEHELLEIMLFLEHLGIVLREGYTVRRNNASIFK